jgi:3-hydroxyisobutyrate dehydrogenase
MRLAVLGTGRLGQPVAERLKTSGYEVIVYNRTRAKAESLRKYGIHVAQRVDEAIRFAEGIFLLLADAAAIQSVMLTESVRKELFARTIIQMGTIGPSESQALEGEIRAAGGEYVEAPVLGSVAEARAGMLQILVGGSPDQFARWVDVLRSLGPEPRHIGPVGKAAALKLALNQMIAAEIAALALSLGLVHRHGIDVETWMAVLRQSALYAPAYDKKLPRLLHRDYADPNFAARHLLKDVDLCLAEAKAQHLTTDALEGIHRLLGKTIAQGFGSADYSALYEVVNPERPNGA